MDMSIYQILYTCLVDIRTHSSTWLALTLLISIGTVKVTFILSSIIHMYVLGLPTIPSSMMFLLQLGMCSVTQ